jgi:hypothetical protein
MVEKFVINGSIVCAKGLSYTWLTPVMLARAELGRITALFRCDCQEVISMLELIRDLWAFLKERKKLWLAPIILILLVLGMLVVLTQGSALAPFVYTLF